MTTAGDLRTLLRIFNTHALLRKFGGPDDNGRQLDVLVRYRASDRWNAGGATIYSPSRDFDPSNYRMGGAKWFSGFLNGRVGVPRREAALADAFEWAEAVLGIPRAEFATCPLDRAAYIPTIVRERCLAALRAARRVEKEGK